MRNVKWVEEIVLSPEEAVGTWQRGISYKGFAPHVTDFKGIDVEKVLLGVGSSTILLES